MSVSAVTSIGESTRTRTCTRSALLPVGPATLNVPVIGIAPVVPAATAWVITGAPLCRT